MDRIKEVSGCLRVLTRKYWLVLPCLQWVDDPCASEGKSDLQLRLPLQYKQTAQ